ncbi:serum amyloid P-component-like [Rhineura floridana]|uniref:serum amyloid P-component-like n=1 Tax=Rhineura floridana TaxID=261503 RepID=UPI002AC82E17|nr:serum amyloid P-component-like [Rhineura floridana]
MKKTSLWPLALLSLSGTLAQTSLDGKVFVFPKASVDSYVLLKPTLEEPLQNFTVCLSFFTDLTRQFSLFSASSRQHDNEILLLRLPDEFYIYVGGETLTYKVPSLTEKIRSLHWETACATWESATGIVQLWLGGQPLPRKGVAKGYRVKTDLVVMLGQDQDSYGGSLDAGQSFVGEMADVYMWDSVLPPEQLRRFQKDTIPTPLVDWAALKFEIKGYVVMEPTLY